MNLQQIRKALSSELSQMARRVKAQAAMKALGGVRVGRGQVSTKSATMLRKPKFTGARVKKIDAAHRTKGAKGKAVPSRKARP